MEVPSPLKGEGLGEDVYEECPHPNLLPEGEGTFQY